VGATTAPPRTGFGLGVLRHPLDAVSPSGIDKSVAAPPVLVGEIKGLVGLLPDTRLQELRRLGKGLRGFLGALRSGGRGRLLLDARPSASPGDAAQPGGVEGARSGDAVGFIVL